MSEKPHFLLLWDEGDGSFHPVNEKGNGIYLELFDEEEKWIFQYSENVSFIARRTALRRANETARVGFVNPNTGERLGINFKCIEENDPYHNLPSKVTRAEHSYNE